MGFKKYIVATILLLGIIAGYGYYLELGMWSLNIPKLDKTLTLPVFIWIIVPAVVLFVATILHMIYYGSKNYFYKRAINKDINVLINIINKRIAKEEANELLSTKELKDIGELIKQLDIEVKEDVVTTLKGVNETINKVNLIKKGKYLPQKELKLSANNLYFEKNLLNKIKEDINFAEDVLKNSSNYKQSVVESAFDRFIKDKSMTTIKKIIKNLKLSDSMIKKLLKKSANTSKEFALSNEDILNYVREANFSNDELIEIAKEYKKTLSPDQLIKLYEDISADNDKFTYAYLYVLFDFQMIDKAKDILLNSQPNEYKPFKALLDLRKAGKHYSLDDLVTK